ncbi:MAG: isopentenyl phosphate kinase [Candidatus Curtissbacteria bacterium]
MKKDFVIIKLGGSVITDKGRGKGTFRRAIIKRLMGEIVSARKKKDFDLILIHGAGSFAHPLAKKYNLHKGYLGPKSVEGFTLTRKAVMDLSLLVWEEVQRVGVGSSCVQSAEVIYGSNGKIKIFNTEYIQNLLLHDMVPILSGDVVFDEKMGFSIISGDKITAYLAKKLKAKRVIFVSDVDGVFDRNPKSFKDAKLISKIDSKNYSDVIKNMTSYNKDDVTGEMAGKILAIKKDLAGFDVQIINGLSANSLKMTLEGKDKGTSILF